MPKPIKGKSLLRSTAIFSGMTLISRLLGFLRDIVLANLFGATAGFDAFLVAFKVPNFMRRLFAEGAFAQAFVPVLAEYQQKHSQHDTQQFINRVAGMLGLALLGATIIAELMTPLLVMMFAPGFWHDPHRFAMATSMLRVTFPYLLLISLTAFSGSILNTFNRFAVPAFTPVLLNISIIICAVFLSPYFAQPVQAVAWGVLLGGVAQLLFQFPFLKIIKHFPRPQIKWRDAGVNKLLKLMVPAMFGVSVAQISLMVDTIFASFLPTGSISWLYYSDRLTNFPLGIFGVGLATVILPHLSRKHADQSAKDFSAALDWGLRSVLVIGVPAAVGLLMLAGPLLTTLFQHGRFSTADVIMAGKSLMAFAVGLPAFMLVKVLASGFYSRQDIRTPVKIAVIALLVNMLLNALFIVPMKHAGLALATSMASWANTLLLLHQARRREVYKSLPGWIKYGLQLLSANVLMAAFLWWGVANINTWFNYSFVQRAEHLLLLVMGAVTVYCAVLWCVGLRLRQFKMIKG